MDAVGIHFANCHGDAALCNLECDDIKNPHPKRDGDSYANQPMMRRAPMYLLA